MTIGSKASYLRRAGFMIGIVLILASALWFIQRWRADRAAKSLADGQQFLKERRSELAEQAFADYLTFAPDDANAILLWAEAIVDGKQHPAKDAALMACEALQRIPDSSPFGAEARMREGRLTLFVLLQPENAERLLMKSRQLDADSMDVHFLLWKLYDLTERFPYAEEHFWNTYELSPESMKTQRLVEWYLSQFSTNSSNAAIDRLLGFLPAEMQTSDAVVNARLDGFVLAAPDSALALTAKAAFLLQMRDRDAAGKLLDNAEQKSGALSDEFFLATKIGYLLDLGKIKEAEALFAQWKAGTQSHLYFRTVARIRQLCQRDDRGAVEAFDKALEIWPGPVDWSGMHLKAQSLAKLGDRSGAEQVRARAKEIELLMEPDVHKTFWDAIRSIETPENMQRFEDFYRKLGREKEAAAWRNRREQLTGR
ncbi:MAG: hypothetical protein U0996_05770 [Planctomycetaceae bacterium]